MNENSASIRPYDQESDMPWVSQDSSLGREGLEKPSQHPWTPLCPITFFLCPKTTHQLKLSSLQEYVRSTWGVPQLTLSHQKRCISVKHCLSVKHPECPPPPQHLQGLGITHLWWCMEITRGTFEKRQDLYVSLGASVSPGVGPGCQCPLRSDVNV